MGVLNKQNSVVVILAVVLLFSRAWASNTMLMFVGEDLDVLSIASKKEEAAWSAPAIADVITREDISKRGDLTIAQALDGVTGFYIEKNEKGSVPFLRGIADSILFLYDTVPMGSGVQKSDHMIDREISLAPVKRIEVIRGAGSVLWGPDAFAGVVNVVPMTGRDFQGIQTGVIGSTQDREKGGYLNFGTDQGTWASFLSVSALSAKEDDKDLNLIRFWNDGITPEPIDTRFGSGSPDTSHSIEFYGNFSLGHWLTLSAKVSDSKKAFAVSDWNHDYSWEESVSSPARIFKVEASKELDMDSGIRFTGYYSQIRSVYEIVDAGFSQEETSAFGELIYDRSVFTSTGLLTLGSSWRQDRYEDIPVFQSFYPEFFVVENTFVVPVIDPFDFANELISVFGQYRHKFDRLELWAGARHDNHEQYADKTSYSLGAAYSFSDYILKSLYGTAYRAPFAKQLDESKGGNLEQISSLNFQLSWKTGNNKAALTFFRNEIDNHVIEDRYVGAGLSTPNSQTIEGVELEYNLRLTEDFKVSGNLTLLDTKGPPETYLYNDFSFIDDAGNVIKNFQELNYDYDPGAEIMFKAMAAWNITKNIVLVPEVKYVSERTLFYPLQDVTKTYDDIWLADVNLLVTDLFPFDLGIHFKNIFDSRHNIPGFYSIDKHDGFSAAVVLKMKW